MMLYSLLIVFGICLSFVDMASSVSTCFCTKAPCPKEGSNYLKVGAETTATYMYVLNENSVPIVSSASVTITRADLDDKGSDTVDCTQKYSRYLDDDGIKDCDAGHILANRLGGPGNSPINIFPQDSSINRGIYAQFEDKIHDCIANGASSATLSWAFKYESKARSKPDFVDYVATFKDGPCGTLTKTFPNVSVKK